MAELYMRDIRSWKDATLLLSFEERGYFDEIISLIYLYNGCIQDDDELICRAMPVNKKVHLRLKKTLIGKGVLQFQDGFYFNSRATQELLKINSKSTQNKLAADKRWAKRLKTNKTGDANAIPIVKVKDEGEANTNVLERETAFLEWFEIYPTHGNAKRAREEFNSALERIEFDDLMKATLEFAEAKRGEDISFIQAPHNWLKYDSWNDPVVVREKEFDAVAWLKEKDAKESENAN